MRSPMCVSTQNDQPEVGWGRPARSTGGRRASHDVHRPPAPDLRSCGHPRVKGEMTMTTKWVRVLMSTGATILLLTISAGQRAWAACSTGGQLARLGESPVKCTQLQLTSLDTVLNNRLEFRAVLDLPLATQVLRERKCPTAEEFEAFFAAWKRLPPTGVNYTVKRYCLTEP